MSYSVQRIMFFADGKYEQRQEFANLLELMEWTVQAAGYFKSELKYQSNLYEVWIDMRIDGNAHQIYIYRNRDGKVITLEGDDADKARLK